MSRWILPALMLIALAGCGPPPKAPATGEGLFADWTPERLAAQGYPGSAADRYSSPEWGLLYDEDGVPYGPKSYYVQRERQEHPYLEVTDQHVRSRWVTIPRSDCCTEPLLGHYLEVCDLAWKDLTRELEYEPPVRITVFSPADMPRYLEITGADFAQAFVVGDQALIVQPIDVLFRRTLAGHVAYAGLAEVMIRMQTHGRAPDWLQVGLASYLAQEGYEHLSFMAEFRPNRESVLLNPTQVADNLVPFLTRESGRIARYNAFLMAWHLSERYGFDQIIQLLAAMAEGQEFEAAVPAVYGVAAATLVADIDPTVLGEPTTTVPPR